MEFNLKKLIRKREVIDIINNITETMETSILIKDVTGEVLVGKEKEVKGEKFWITVDDKVVGWVVGDKKAESLANILTYMANAEYEKKILINETLDKYREITLLYNVSEKITSCLDKKKASKLAISEATRLISATNAQVSVVHRDSKKLEKVAEFYDEKAECKADNSSKELVNQVMNKGAGEIINDANGSKSSLICAPLKIKDKTVGIIKLENSNQVNYSSEDLKLLNAIATQAAIAIENANLYDSLREAFFETVQILVEVVEKRDSYTAGHARRVAIYSTAIGEELGLTKTDLTKVKLAALLHDIGKIGIQDEILLKKGKLTNEEYEAIKKHPILGAELLENITQFKDIVPYVRSHHERYDGRGYPDGIHKENIPLVSRILAVADSFDAMTSNRPYRPTMNREYAFDELKKNASTQFDPMVVEAFLKRIKM